MEIHGIHMNDDDSIAEVESKVLTVLKKIDENISHQDIDVQGDPKRCVPMKISIVTLIKKLFISNYNHPLFSLWKTIHQSFNYFCRFLVNLWLSQDGVK